MLWASIPGQEKEGEVELNPWKSLERGAPKAWESYCSTVLKNILA